MIEITKIKSRASRPSFRNSHDKVAFVVHASFLYAGFVLTATGPPAFATDVFSSSTSDGVGINPQQSAGRVFCKKGCGADGETWDECVSECDQICYKDPVLKDQQWSSYIDRSPGAATYSEMEYVRAQSNPKADKLLAIGHLMMRADDLGSCDTLLKIRRCSMLARQVCIAAVVGVSYGIWKCRNKCRVDGYVMLPARLVSEVKEECKRRIPGVFQGSMYRLDRDWCRQHGLS